MLLSGMGQVHLEVTIERLKRKFGAEVLMKTPKVPYRETIKLQQEHRVNIKNSPVAADNMAIAGWK